MESTWDTIWLFLGVLLLLIALARLILHFARPVTWRDGDGPAVRENGGWASNFWADVLHLICWWR